MNKPNETSYWVVKSKLLAGEYPDKLKSFIDFGVNCFIDLTGSRFPSYEEKAKALSKDVKVYCYPIPNRSVPSRNEDMKKILDSIDQNINEGRIVYVHCQAGIGRTGTVIGCWLARNGYPGIEALRKLNELWVDNPISKYIGTPETSLQCEYVLNWNENNS